MLRQSNLTFQRRRNSLRLSVVLGGCGGALSRDPFFEGRPGEPSCFQYLPERALLWALVRAPPHKFCTVPEAIARDVVEADLHYEFWTNGLPLSAPLRAPPARAARGFAGKSRR